MSLIPDHAFIPCPLPPAGAAKKALHDGEKPVTSITVLGMFRNNGAFLSEFLFKQLECMEATYDCEFAYYFIENDSKDDTRELLKAWFAGASAGGGSGSGKKKGKLMLGKLNPSEHFDPRNGECFARTSLLSRLRNTVIGAAMPLTSQWTIFFDSHIYWKVNIVERMLALKPASEAAAGRISMITPYTHQVYTHGQLKGMGLTIKSAQGLDDGTRMTMTHMFDTYTYINESSQHYFPCCAFARCQLCPFIRGADYKLPLVDASVDIVDCKSTFNGFALIESEALNHPRVRWGTIPFDGVGKMSLCDHVLLCDRLATVTGKRIVLVQSIDDVYRTY